MQQQGRVRSKYGLEMHGITNIKTVWWNLSTPTLYEHAMQRREGLLAHLGPLVINTGPYTGRSPKDKYFVREPSSQDKIGWGDVNRPVEAARYEALRARLIAHLQGKDLYVQDCYIGADPQYRIPIRVLTEAAWQNLFARNMFIQEPDLTVLAEHVPHFTVIAVPGFHAVPEVDETRSEAFVQLHFGRREVIIGGTAYAGEIKKAMFTVATYLLPLQDVLPMHCSANFGADEDDVAIFFGLSGTGKTTLSTDADRTLIGDDEHGWSANGVFNIEGGCYAKVINLSSSGEPEIYDTTRRFGTILENVVMDEATRRLDLSSEQYTENTRACYPIPHIPKATRVGTGGHPNIVLMLTADAFGVLPPIARLTPAQAMYHFLSGYTAKVAGTERGITEPEATFSACFGAPFMAMHPAVYAKMLGERIARHHVQVWLVNTGWNGGPYGVGQRIKLSYTRALVRAALQGTLAAGPMTDERIFGIQIPQNCPGVPSEILQPRQTWKDPAAYDSQAAKLAGMFGENFQQFNGDVADDIRTAGPRQTVST